MLCSIHPRMRAVVLVLQNQFFAKPDASGDLLDPRRSSGEVPAPRLRARRAARAAAVTVKEKGPTEVPASALKSAPAPAK